MFRIIILLISLFSGTTQAMVPMPLPSKQLCHLTPKERRLLYNLLHKKGLEAVKRHPKFSRFFSDQVSTPVRTVPIHTVAPIVSAHAEQKPADDARNEKRSSTAVAVVNHADVAHVASASAVATGGLRRDVCTVAGAVIETAAVQPPTTTKKKKKAKKPKQEGHSTAAEDKKKCTCFDEKTPKIVVLLCHHICQKDPSKLKDLLSSKQFKLSVKMHVNKEWPDEPCKIHGQFLLTLYAIENGTLDIIKTMYVSKFFDFAKPNTQWVTPLHFAAKDDKFNDILTFLINHLEFKSFSQSTSEQPIHVAAELGAVKNVRAMISKYRQLINLPFGRNKFTPLAASLFHGKTEVASMLLEHKADIYPNHGAYGNVLTLACEESKHAGASMVPIITRILELDARNRAEHKSPSHIPLAKQLMPTGLSLFNFAIQYRFIAIFDDLIQHGAEVNPDDHIAPPLSTAAHYRDLDIGQILLKKHNANPNLPNKHNTRPLHAALLGEKKYRANLIPFIKLLLDHGADCNIPKGNYAPCAGYTPLMCAIHAGSTLANQELCAEIIKIFVEQYHADVNIITATGINALCLAFMHKQEKIAEYLLEKGASPNFTIYEGRPLIHEAAELGWVNVAKMLVERHSFNVNEKDGDGKLPLDYVQDNPELISFLESKGAVRSVTTPTPDIDDDADDKDAATEAADEKNLDAEEVEDEDDDFGKIFTTGSGETKTETSHGAAATVDPVAPKPVTTGAAAAAAHYTATVPARPASPAHTEKPKAPAKAEIKTPAKATAKIDVRHPLFAKFSHLTFTSAASKGALGIYTTKSPHKRRMFAALSILDKKEFAKFGKNNKKLAGPTNSWRVRFGDHRLTYEVQADNSVRITNIDARKRIYK